VKVIASQIRKGNVVEIDDNLFVVLKAESFFPGKGTPTTQIDMRRLSDGVKTVQRYRTTEQVERAFIETKEHNYMYEDAHGFTFMNMESYEQVSVPPDVVGDLSIYLAENMPCQISLYNGVPVGIELPTRVTLEIVETEPDRVLVLQAGQALERRPHHGSAAYQRRYPRGDPDGRRLVCGARERLTLGRKRPSGKACPKGRIWRGV